MGFPPGGGRRRAGSRTVRAATVLVLAWPMACAPAAPDASGTFEAVEVTLSAETGGPLLAVLAAEGARVEAQALLAVVDTTALTLQRDELLSRRRTLEARREEVRAQAGVVEAQQGVAARELARAQRLVRAAAATAQQADRAERDVRTLEAQRRAFAATGATVARELATVEVSLAQVADRVRRARVVAPQGGTVLARYVEPGELVQPGAPVVKLAALDTLVLRAYVAGNQLARVPLGGAVTVQVDAPEGGLRTLSGVVTWVSSTAEFTPTPIQTREERVTQVYAVKVRVANPGGALKIGMPGELVLPAPSPSPAP
jgi:HlyD family secretion protein